MGMKLKLMKVSVRVCGSISPNAFAFNSTTWFSSLSFYSACIVSDSEQRNRTDSLEVTATFSSEERASQSSSSNEIANDTDVSDRRTILLTSYYNLLHYLRWPAIFVSLGAIIVCSYVASGIQTPNANSQMTPALLPSNNRYERHREWSGHLLAPKLMGSREVLFVWGSIPADTSHRMDPGDTSILLYDETFDPSNDTAQVYLYETCKILPLSENAEGKHISQS